MIVLGPLQSRVSCVAAHGFSGPVSVSVLQHLCAPLQVSVFRMAIAIALRVALTGSHDAAQLWGPMRPQPFTHRSRSVRTAVACAAFHDLVTWTRPAVDARVVVSASTWSAMLVPFIWTAAAHEAAFATDPG